MKDSILIKFNKNIEEITDYYKKLIYKTKRHQNVGSSNEWIVDNYYVISEQEKYIKQEYKFKELKKISKKRKEKIYNIVYRYLKESDFNLSISNMVEKLNKYQITKRDYFSYREISFIYILVRIILINELNIMANNLNQKLNEKEEIESIFNKINDDIKKNNFFEISKYININEMLIDKPHYIEQINYRLKELGDLSEESFIELNELLIKNNLSLKDLIKTAHNNKANENILIINIFKSIKKIAKHKLEYLYKGISFAEKALINEQALIYDQMYDNNKVEYRTKLIRMAKKHKKNEYEFAKEIVEKANQEEKHVGWHLFKPKSSHNKAALYLSVIIIVTLLVSYAIGKYLGYMMIPILLVPISIVVTEFSTQILRNITKSKSLFKIKFEEGLPTQYSTMVVIPTIIKNTDKIEQMLASLEVYYLSNRTDNIYFTLLGDCSSEDIKELEIDNTIAEYGIKKVQELNEKYGKKIFNFIYRNRFYNEGEECFLGFERKRGALIHFNRLLLNKLTAKEKKEYFKVHTFENFDVPIKYVITLDTDTKLVLNTALKMIGAMAHPLNQPVLSKNKKKVIGGYGLMQPRVGIDVEVTNKSLYSQLFAGLGGLDIYTTAAFDLYQDVFGEGSFVGKGIYDLEVFDNILSEAFPNNLILSHDLLEGNYLKCGFINDVELFDDYPARYLNDAARHHRWNRGDWQIIGWLKKKVKNVHNQVVSNPINLLAKWRIFDNLRRSLLSVFLLLILFFGFTIGKGNVIYYFLLVLFIIAIPILFFLLTRMIYRQKYDIFLKYYLNIIIGIIAVINKSYIVLALLPFEAKMYIDSIIKALYRQFVSKKRLLNWMTAEEVENVLKNDFKTYLKAFKINYLTSILLVIMSIIFKPESISIALIISVIWFMAPVLMYLISRDIPSKPKDLNDSEKEEIKEIAERTWKYFEELLVEEYNYLIPDNYQFNREKKVDYKTSPTNIGFSLVSIVSAYELELISSKRAVNLIVNVIRNVEALPKWNGHLYNWYNIHTKKELPPYFVSSVDSGNFVVCLFVVKEFLKKYGNQDSLFRINKLVDEMDFTKLYNADMDLFSIGYHGGDQSLLKNHYDNFASETRLTSYIAIAKGDVDFKHWFSLDKTLTKYKFYKGIASWSGTAFEYFMPLIFMKTYDHTLLDETYFFAFYTQKEFIRHIKHDLPWGISESAYNELDDSENYKYQAFGVPYLKLRDSKSYPIIISPYSSLMAIGIDDREVYINIKKLKKLKMYGDYGFYESYDYEDKAIVKTYYAHHQGMILSSLTNYLKDNAIQEYFHSNKNVQAIEMLLKEKVQIKTYIDLKIAKYKKYQYVKEKYESDVREYDKLKPIPEVEVLSNGFYSILIDDRGAGLSKYKNLQINRRREIESSKHGIFVYIKNLNNNNIWSNTYEPLNGNPQKYKAIFASDRVKYVREDEGIVTNTEVTVVKDHNAEIRRLTFKNNSNKDAYLEITSYGEVIMSRNEEDVAHRAFNSLTIHTEVDHKRSALIFSRRSLTKENTKYFVMHRMFLDNENDYSFEYETSRYHFLGRNNDVSNPDVIINNKPLSKFMGAAIDPIMSIRKKILVKAKSKENVYLLVGFGKSKEQINEIMDIYKDKPSIERAFEITTVFNNMRNSYANITANQMRLYNLMLKYIYQSIPLTKEKKELLSKNMMAQPNLWKFGISGDWPIILLEIDKIEDAGFIKDVLQAYEFYKSRALYIDIVIINKEDMKKDKLISNYIGNLMYRINSLNYFENSPGGVWTIASSEINNEENILLKSVARIHIDASLTKTLEEQILMLEESLPSIKESKLNYIETDNQLKMPEDISFYNKYGGFVNDGKEYLINNNDTPTPWVNILANKDFGTVVSNNLGGFTYAFNSREYKLTKWSNDAVSDPSSEMIIINKEIFKPNLVKHGLGYSIFEASTKEYTIAIRVFVGLKNPIKFYSIDISNKTDNNQNLAIDFMAKMVLGVTEEIANRHIISNFNKNDNTLYMKNTYNSHFSDVEAFMSSTESIVEYNDEKNDLKGIKVNVELKKAETYSFAFMLGARKEDIDISKYKNIDIINKEFKEVAIYFENKFSNIIVNTPDKSFDYVINGWYLYQTYIARLIAKTGYYQVSGATGFRDQLQDVMSILYVDSEYARKQILKHAKHQFKEGDVLHWWHEEMMNGLRTRFSDDYLWLIYVTYEYIKITGDNSILKEEVSFVEGPELDENESERGFNFSYSTSKESLYNHLKLCINKALRQFGNHGLPLMGSGDWNDGMNKVGYKGRGESVFVGFFLYDLLFKMADIAKMVKDKELEKTCLAKTEVLKQDLNKNAWDGAWYLRAFFDNGIPMGSRNNRECQIDLLSQAWSILSEVADDEKKHIIFAETESRLVDRNNKIIKLLTPPFRKTRNNPGYIKDYVAGLRENGGQYTHAALWYIMALLKEKKIDIANEYYQMINPINRSLSKTDVLKYKTEPYVLAADMYANMGHLGRGGWTWYTGSSAWAYKVAIEEILGFKKKGKTLTIEPKTNSKWSEFEIKYKYLNTNYLIKVTNPNNLASGKVAIKMDGKKIKDNIIKLVDDKKNHKISVNIMEE